MVGCLDYIGARYISMRRYSFALCLFAGEECVIRIESGRVFLSRVTHTNTTYTKDGRNQKYKI